MVWGISSNFSWIRFCILAVRWPSNLSVFHFFQLISHFLSFYSCNWNNIISYCWFHTFYRFWFWFEKFCDMLCCERRVAKKMHFSQRAMPTRYFINKILSRLNFMITLSENFKCVLVILMINRYYIEVSKQYCICHKIREEDRNITRFKGATKSYFMYYLCVPIIFSIRAYQSLHFHLLFVETSFTPFCVLFVFCAKSFEFDVMFIEL